jgi:hypothetical protein
MDKKIAGLLGAVAALSTVGAAQASTPTANSMQANSYTDLLKPVPNAMSALVADDAARTSRSQGGVKTAQISVEIGHHHHHHHHHRRIIIRHHHHHHHHKIIIRHHHHHHYHSQYMAIPRKDA